MRNNLSNSLVITTSLAFLISGCSDNAPSNSDNEKAVLEHLMKDVSITEGHIEIVSVSCHDKQIKDKNMIALCRVTAKAKTPYDSTSHVARAFGAMRVGDTSTRDREFQFEQFENGWRLRPDIYFRLGITKVPGSPYIDQSRPNVSNPPVVQPNNKRVDGGESSRLLIGEWTDGDSACLSVGEGKLRRQLVLQAWPCSTEKSIGRPISVEFDATVSAYVHELTGFTLRPINSETVELEVSREGRKTLGGGVYLSNFKTSYRRR